MVRNVNRPSVIKAALFDFDGVICDTEPLASRVLADALAVHGVRLTHDEEVSLVGTDGVAHLRAILDARGCDIPSRQVMDESEERGNIHLIYPMIPMPNTLQTIAALREGGLAMALVSTTLSPYVLHCTNELDITHLFDSIVCGDMVTEHKPSPECYLKSLANLGVDASEAVVFEDSPVGIHAAKSAELYVFGFRGSIIKQDTSEADVTFDSFEDFSVEALLHGDDPLSGGARA